MIEVKEMPLYWRFKDSIKKEKNVPPSRVPFVFDFDQDLNLFIEKRSLELSSLLADIYSRNTNVGFLQDGHSLLQTYGEDFWGFLIQSVNELSLRSVLEIGCGGCVFLERLKEHGYQVTGVDPSPFAVEAGRSKGIEVIQDFFPVPNFDCSPDLIFQVDVLEHIEDPVAFLRSQAECIDDDGLIIVNVPDCTRSIEMGDISMALHQHVNMFDSISLSNVFTAAGLEVMKLERSKYGAALYCAARKTKKIQQLKIEGGVERWDTFQNQSKKIVDSFIEHVDRAKSEGSIGFFMPQRAFPYLGMLGWFEGYRVFDNMNVWHNRYLDGLDIKIENQQNLIDRPVDHLFIMSLTFGKEVSNSLNKVVSGMKITTLENIIST